MNEQNMSANDYAKYRIEMTRRELMELSAKVEMGTDYGYRLSEILVNAINEVESLAEEASQELT